VSPYTDTTDKVPLFMTTSHFDQIVDPSVDTCLLS